MKAHSWVFQSIYVRNLTGIISIKPGRRCIHCGIEIQTNENGSWPKFEPYQADCDEQIIRQIHES
jgi:hypothetical protein